jgi:transposase InsO family protein
MCENRHPLPGLRVVQVLERVAQERGLPEAIQVDNGPEFISRVVDQRAYASGVTLHYIDPSKPVQNAFIESFNGKFRDGSRRGAGQQCKPTIVDLPCLAATIVADLKLQPSI